MIKNKDGTPFRLRGPNPAMASQSFWETDNCALHNFQFAEFTSKHIDMPMTMIPEELPTMVPAIDPVPEQFEELHDIEPEEIDIDVTIKPLVMNVHCLPAQVTRIVDKLYNETKIKLVYGKQISIQITPVYSSDIAWRFWTGHSITEGSVVFMPKERRWWKIVTAIPSSNGFIAECIPSEATPSFQAQS